MKWTREQKIEAAHKKFWIRGESEKFDEVLDFVESLRDGLTNDLLNQYEGDRHTQIDQVLQRSDCRPVLEEIYDVKITDDIKDNMIRRGNKKGDQAWQAVNLKYGWDLPGKHSLSYYGERPTDEGPSLEESFPTAKKFLDEFAEEEITIATYSILTSNSAVYRHTGMENRKGSLLRCHIPLYVPPGDLFLEAAGDEITWDESFGFNNQFIHSAYNNTPEHRLCFIFDIDRERIGIPYGLNFTNYGFQKISGIKIGTMQSKEEFVRTSIPRPYTGKYQSD